LILAWTHVGTDAISNAFIYKKDVVKIADGTAVAVDLNPVNDRPPLAVTFEEIATRRHVSRRLPTTSSRRAAVRA
jgi:predicted extracellular nuclease